MRSQEKSLLNLNLNHNQMRIPLHFLMTKSRIEATLLRPPECDRVTGWRDDAGDPTPVTTQTRPSQNIIGCFSSKLWRSDHYVSSTSNSVSLTTMFTTSEWQFCNQAVSNQHVCKHVCNQAECNLVCSRLLQPPPDPAADPGPEHVAGAHLHRGHVPALPHPQVSVGAIHTWLPGHWVHLPSWYTCSNIELLRIRTKCSPPLHKMCTCRKLIYFKSDSSSNINNKHLLFDTSHVTNVYVFTCPPTASCAGWWPPCTRRPTSRASWRAATRGWTTPPPGSCSSRPPCSSSWSSTPPSTSPSTCLPASTSATRSATCWE